MKSCTAPPNTAPITSQRKPGKKAELRRQHRPKQRTRPGNRREVMTEQHVFIGGMKIDAVVQPHRRRDPLIVQLNHALRNPAAIETKGQHIDAGRRHDQPEAVYFFLGIDETGNIGKRDRAKNGEQYAQSTCFNADIRGILTQTYERAPGRFLPSF